MSDSDSDFEGANEYTGLMDGHVAGEVVTESASDKSGRRKKSQSANREDASDAHVSFLTSFEKFYSYFKSVLILDETDSYDKCIVLNFRRRLMWQMCRKL